MWPTKLIVAILELTKTHFLLTPFDVSMCPKPALSTGSIFEKLNLASVAPRHMNYLNNNKSFYILKHHHTQRSRLTQMQTILLVIVLAT